MTAAPEVELVDAPALYVVGELVAAPFDRLHVEVPRAWERLAANGVVEGRRLAEASFTTEAGYVEVVGVLGEQPPETVPAGQVPVVMPAGRYARLVHEGPVTAIADGFARIYAWAEENGIRLGARKLDIGYERAGAHELRIDVVSGD